MKVRHFLKVASALPVLWLTAMPGVCPAQGVDQIRVQPDKAPDSSSLKSIVDTVTRGCKNNDEKAVAIYNYCMLTNYHRAYPTEPGGIPVLKEINSYGWSLCGGLHTVQSALWIQAGFEHRYVGWNGHTTVEAKYDGRWHYLDVFLHFYAWEPDGKGGRTIASEDDLTHNSDELIRNAFVLDESRGCVYAKADQFVMNGGHANWRAPAFLSCGDTINDVISGMKTHHAGGPESGWAGINHDTGAYSTDVNLAPGMSLVNKWDPTPNDWYWAGSTVAPGHTCSGHKDTRNDPAYGLILEPYVNREKARSYANGTLSFDPDFSNDSFLKAFVSADNVKYAGNSLTPVQEGKPASVVLKLTSPYIISGVSSGSADGADKIEVSTDGGKTYGEVSFDKLGAAAKGKLAAMVRITFTRALKSLHVSLDVMNNPGALPYLSPGKNVIAVSVADPKALGDNKLVVTYAYRLGSRGKSFDQLCDEGKEIANQRGAAWSNTVTYARKVFSAKDLPASFEIDCPTPKGKFPVYPRMLWMSREVVSATSSPAPLPQGTPAMPASPEELQTLPDPFLIGTETPAPIKERSVRTERIPLDYVQFCNEKGEVSTAGELAWPKSAAEKGKVIEGAVVFDGDLKSLPPAKRLAGARIVFPVTSGHKKAGEKIGAVFLSSPVEKGKALNFASLETLAGTAIVPIQPDQTPQYTPARPFAIDVTKAVKAVAAGDQTFHGIALRIVPDRGVDDGYTVRCVVSAGEKAYLEVDEYSE
jgi:hypothetical protein